VSATTDLLVRMEHCSKSYRRGSEAVAALTDVTFTLTPGQLVALVGPSGSGKTTLLNLLVGWEQPDRGRIVWPAHTNPSRQPGWEEVGIVPQRLGLLEELTVDENITLPLMLGPTPRSAPPGALVTALGLDGLTDRFPDEVSLGEQQRAAIARALVLGPPLVVLDEPTGHQDEHAAKLVLDALQQACDQGSTCLIATHSTDIADGVPPLSRTRTV
jgi:putative ABC transport system ATP-binding protein